MKPSVPLVLAAIVAAGLTARAAAPAHPTLGGVWTLDREHSAFPADIGFDVPATLLGGVDGSQGTSRGRGRGGGGGGSGSVATAIITESQDDAKRLHQLIAELKDPPVTLTINDTETRITISAADGAPRVFHPNGKEDIQQLTDVPVATKAKWNGSRLEVTYAVEKDRELRYDYSRADDSAPLVVAASPRDHGKGDVITRIYRLARGRR